MVVYVLWWQLYDKVEIWGVYSSIEEAEKQIPDDVEKDYEYEGFHIEEFELNDFV
ncbi:DUF7336 domain-containing protein [Pediococcus pentosaceus]|uniref:DUF7336 domain-containing protein n=1 Tax=Pediococcus pentosaceus TaxID=1255 RepID=UPI001F572B39|nr:hypothetical protein [Pediococcus pentosaceus]MCI2961032.1 hypothetical protein [Pediococcus pentosaceus]